MNDKYRRTCHECHEVYFINPHYGVNYPGKYCNRICYFRARKGVRVSPETEFKRIHAVSNIECACGKFFATNTARIADNRGKYCSTKCRYNYAMAGDERHGLWKGDGVGYHALHSWVARKLGSPKSCSNCGLETDNSRQFHWANISREYKRDLDDWARLCASCHKKYDMGVIELCVQA